MLSITNNSICFFKTELSELKLSDKTKKCLLGGAIGALALLFACNFYDRDERSTQIAQNQQPVGLGLLLVDFPAPLQQRHMAARQA